FFLYCACRPRHLPSFPTRRSSDLLPESLRERYVSKGGKWLLRIFGTGNLWEYPELSRFVASVRTIDPEATGKPFTTLEGLRAIRSEEHTSELQSLTNLVCRLLLQK